MRTLEVHLPNGSDGDALVHVTAREQGWGLLFDAGDPGRLSLRDVLRLEHLFVSHCHVDHFVGFDALLRPRVCRTDRLHAHGPPGFLDRVQARLEGYTWNLVEGNHCVLVAHEVHERTVRTATFDSGQAFARVDGAEREHDGVTWRDERLSVESRALDHLIVSQGWAVELAPTWSVRTERLAERGLPPGPWLARLKEAAARGDDGDEILELPDGAREPLAEVVDALLERRRGDRVAFVTDTACTARTRPRMVALAAQADVFACGAPFLAAEAERARQTHHLTAAEAGAVAAEAGVRRLLLFHVSDRYGGDFRRHADEASRAAGGRVEVETRPALPRPPS